MAKKRPPKKTVIKKGFRKVAVPKPRDSKGQLKRGLDGTILPANTIHFEGVTGKMKDPDNIPKSTLKYYITKHRKKAGQINPQTDKPFLPEPQAIVLIVKLFRNDSGPRKVLSLVSPPDMIVNEKNVRKFIKDQLDNLEGNIEEKFQGRYEDQLNTERITDYSLKFIY